MPIKKTVWLFVFAIFSGLLSSQNLSFNFHKIGTEEGMNSLNVFNIQQNENRLMHVTTENGVYVYNGYSFNLIKSDSLKNATFISSFIKDRSSIYLSTRENGVVEFNYRTKNYNQLTPKNYAGNPDQIIVTANYIYLLTSEIKLEMIDVNAKKLIDDEVKTKEKSNQAYCIYKSKDGRILLGRSDGLYELKDNKQIKLNTLKNLPVYCITENNAGQLVIGSSSKIYFVKDNKLEKEIVPTYKNKVTTFSIGGDKNINKVICDAYDRIWFTSYPNENIYVYDKGITHDVFSELNITPLLINCIYKDKDENIWIGTFDDGIYFIQNTFFRNVNINTEDKILGVNKIFFKDDHILTATSNGLYAYDVNKNNIKTISAPDNILMEPINDIKEFNNTIYYTKRSQFDLSPNTLTTNKGKCSVKPLVAKLVHPLNSNQFIICDWQANVLLANHTNKIIDTLISFPDYMLKINSIYSNKDTLLLATNKGLYYYNFKTDKNTLISKKTNQKVNEIAVINGQILIGGEESIEFLNNNKEIKMLGNKALNSVKKIKSKNNHIWIVTLDGLFICDSALNPIKIFNKSNGLLSNYVNDIAFNDEYACISTSKGISIAKTENLITFNTTINNISIDHLKLEDKIIYFNDEPIKLSTTDNDVTVFFNSPYFTRPNKQFFRYKLDNSNWAPLENTAFNLPSLSGGKHTLAIEASADNINWSEPTVIEFNKEVKFSETQYSNWIIIISSLLVISLISYLIIKRVKTRAMKRIKDEQQVNLLKHQAMNSLLSPHFIFNSLTSIQNYINSNNSLKASEYLAKFSRLIRMIIEKAAQGEILLKDEITRLTYYLELEKERFKNKFDYIISVDDAIDINTVSIPNMIIQPHAENCIIHGILPKMEHGTLKISFEKTNAGKLLITIEDDGIGLIKAKEHSKTGHKSLGTSTIQSILELNSKLTGKTQVVKMIDKSTISADKTGTIITLELEL